MEKGTDEGLVIAVRLGDVRAGASALHLRERDHVQGVAEMAFAVVRQGPVEVDPALGEVLQGTRRRCRWSGYSRRTALRHWRSGCAR